MVHLNYILQNFETISGLKVNFLKSSLASIGVVKEDLEHFSTILRCKVEDWPLKYLGLPLGGSPKLISFWDLVVERMQKKLVCWKKNPIFCWEAGLP